MGWLSQTVARMCSAAVGLVSTRTAPRHPWCVPVLCYHVLFVCHPCMITCVSRYVCRGHCTAGHATRRQDSYQGGRWIRPLLGPHVNRRTVRLDCNWVRAQTVGDVVSVTAASCQAGMHGVVTATAKLALVSSRTRCQNQKWRARSSLLLTLMCVVGVRSCFFFFVNPA